METRKTPLLFSRPAVLLRAESAVALVLTIGVYAHFFPGHWLFFALLFLFPDVALLAFLAGPSLAASAFYNLLHTLTLPLLGAAYAWMAHSNLGVRFGLLWIAHIAFDRVLGYGLKYESSFRFTHLQAVSSPGVSPS